MGAARAAEAMEVAWKAVRAAEEMEMAWEVARVAEVTAAEGMVAAPLAVAVVDRLGDASLVALPSMMAAPKAVEMPTR